MATKKLTAVGMRQTKTLFGRVSLKTFWATLPQGDASTEPQVSSCAYSTCTCLCYFWDNMYSWEGTLLW